jgi:2-iminobutanoate/2-iminopropanoate deaminase
MKQQIKTDQAPKADLILSQAIVSGGLIFVSGQVHATPDGALVDGTVEQKLERAVQNVRSILQAADADLQDVLKVALYVTDMAILPEINRLWTQYFPEPLPAREAVCVVALPLGASLELSIIATKRGGE